jgi:dTDP-4-dehydrorhamnose 3,5-epimerase
MSVHVTDFDVRHGAISGLLVVTMKQVADERGTIRELFRRSAFERAGIELGAFSQINVTESRRGSVRGMHAEHMTKLLSVASGEAFGAYVDLRPESATFGVVETVELRLGIEVLVPAGVANGFQAIVDPTHYAYCFDHEWAPGMPGRSCSPLDPDLAIAWPIAIDPDDPSQLSTKDRDSASFAQVASLADPTSRSGS